MALQILLLLRPSVCITVIPWIEYKWHRGLYMSDLCACAIGNKFYFRHNAVHEDIIMFFGVPKCAWPTEMTCCGRKAYFSSRHIHLPLLHANYSVWVLRLSKDHTRSSKQRPWLYNV